MKKALDLDWKITKPVNIYADQDTVKNFIEQIKTLEIEDFVSDKPADLAAYGLQDVTFEICVTKEDDKQLARFYVGSKQKDGTKCYVKRVNEDPVYTVATAEFYDRLENAILAFRDRLVSEFDKELAKRSLSKNRTAPLFVKNRIKRIAKARTYGNSPSPFKCLLTRNSSTRLYGVCRS